MNFKERFLAVLEECQCSKSKAAELLNVSAAYISQLSSGVREPSDRTISDICRIFSAREEWLRTGEGEMFEPKTREEEIAELVGRTLNGGGNEFRQAVVKMICSRSESELQALEAALRNIYENL